MKNLILTLLFLVLTTTSIEARVYLVSVGIADYPRTANDLNLCARDAMTIKNLYDKNSANSSILLTNEQATLQNVTVAMNKVYSLAGKNDIVVFFFSGHGTPGNFVCYDGMLKYETIRTAMARSMSKHRMIFADACFSGKMRNTKKRTHSASIYSNLELMLFLSSRSGEKSIEKGNMSNGIFTAYLERGLRGGADSNHDRIITAKELFYFVSKRVQSESSGRQHPVMWGKFSDNMPVMSW